MLKSPGIFALWIQHKNRHREGSSQAIYLSKTGYGPLCGSESQCCSWDHIHTHLCFIPLSPKGENCPWHTLFPKCLGTLSDKVSQTDQRIDKDLANNSALQKISFCLVLFISFAAAWEARVIKVLDAFVLSQPHAFLTCFLDQPAIFFYGPKILREGPLCYLYLITNTLRLDVTGSKGPSWKANLRWDLNIIS